MIDLLRSVTGRILVESHRGAEALAPANSWRALRAGLTAGADLIELDVQLSADGIPFLHHNYSLPDGRSCRDVPWSELAAIVIDGEALPRLDEVLTWAREAQANLSLVLKTGFLPEGALTTQVLHLIDQTQTLDRVILLAWDHKELTRIKETHPKILTRALIRGRLVDLPVAIQAARADSVSLSYDLIRPSDVEQVHALGVAVALVEMWQPDFEFATRSGADIVSWGNPIQAKQELCRTLG